MAAMKIMLLSLQLTLITQGFAMSTYGHVVFVVSDVNITLCANASVSCVTLNELVPSKTDSHSVFHFMPVMHFLEASLTFSGLVNVTFRGENSKQSRVVSSGKIALEQCEGVTFENLGLKSSGKSNTTFLSITNSNDISFFNVHFHGNNLHVGNGSVLAHNSSLMFTTVHFTRSVSWSTGGAITASNSIITMNGDNTFTENTARNNGGALHIHSCDILFDGTTKFTNNTAGISGGGIAAKDSSIVFTGVTIFERNLVLITDGNPSSPHSSQDDDAHSKHEEEWIPNGHMGKSSSTSKGSGGALFLNNSQIELLDGSILQFTSNFAPNGGAVLAQNSTFITTNSSSMRLESNYAAGLGGGIFLNDSTAILLGKSAFHHNIAKHGGSIHSLASSLNLNGHTEIKRSLAEISGGGIFINQGSFELEGALEILATTGHIKGSAIYIHNSTGVRFSGSLTVRDCFQSDMELEGTLYIEISIVSFSGATVVVNNSAYEGGGIYLLESTAKFTGSIRAIQNSAKLNGGVIYMERSKAGLLNVTFFENNQANVQGGSVYMSLGSILFLSGEATFARNTAREGGVLALDNGASLIYSSPLHITAAQNHADLNGGVLYHRDVISTTDCAERVHSTYRPLPTCFLELNSTLPFNISSLSITFNNSENTAKEAGSFLYGGNLRRCRLLVSDMLQLDSDDKCEVIQGGHYERDPFEVIMAITRLNSELKIDDIGSAPLQICFCTNGTHDCNASTSISIIRGETFHVSVMTLGQFGNPEPSVVRTDIIAPAEIRPEQRQQITHRTCTDISYQVFTNNSTATLILYPNGPCRDTGIARKEIHVTLLDCPDGFNQSISGKECICEDRLLALNASCNIDKRSIQVGSGTWLRGLYENGSYIGIIFHRSCPFDYCLNMPTNMTLENPDVLCNKNRTGSLCGACMANYSLALASFNCLKCSNHYLALLIPFALAGIVLVIFLLLLDLTVAKGTINGLILYANIVQANKYVFFPKQQRNFLTVFIAWLNLDLGIESCFFDGLSAYTHTWLQFAFPLYVWFLISLITFFSHKSRRVTRLLSTNPVAVLATLLLMSYAKVLQTIICALSRTYLDTPHGHKAVWMYDGNMDYFHNTRHIALALVACLALVILFLPYSLLLMFGYKLQYLSGVRLFSWITKIKPFMDTIYGPFRTDARYWTGLLLVIRCILFLIFALYGDSPNAGSSASNNLLAILMVFAALAVVAWLNGRVYNFLYNDILEAAYILNITIFTAATYHVKVVQGDQATLAHISLSIAFILFIGVVLFHMYQRVENRVWWKRLRIEMTLFRWYEKVKNRLVCGDCLATRKKTVDSTSVQNDYPDLSIKDGEPTSSYVTFREPLLDS